MIFVMKLQKPFIQLVFFLCDTCCLSQSISTISCSLSDMRDAFDVFEFHLYANEIKFELCAMLLSNNFTCVLMTYVWIPCSLLPEPSRMYMFLCGCKSSMVYLIRNLYIWERSPFSWYPISFCATLCFIYNSLVASKFVSWVLVLLFIGIFAHSCISWRSFDLMPTMVSMLNFIG